MADTNSSATAAGTGNRTRTDICKIRPGLYQRAAMDDCSRYFELGLARRASAAATLTFLDRMLDEHRRAVTHPRNRSPPMRTVKSRGLSLWKSSHRWCS